jgi:hypothetical protein
LAGKWITWKSWRSKLLKNRFLKFKFFSFEIHKVIVVPLLRFVYTRDLDLAISLSNAISKEILPSFQIATAGDSDNI